VQFSVTFPTKFCCHCHCANCRRAHGAAFVTWAGFLESQFKLTAGAEALVRFNTPTGATRSFCRICGTTLFYQSPRWAGEIHIALANLKGDIDRPPEAHVYFDERVPWIEMSDSLTRIGQTSDSDKD